VSLFSFFVVFPSFLLFAGSLLHRVCSLAMICCPCCALFPSPFFFLFQLLQCDLNGDSEAKSFCMQRRQSKAEQGNGQHGRAAPRRSETPLNEINSLPCHFEGASFPFLHQI
jgi:hypothetical protein